MLRDRGLRVRRHSMHIRISQHLQTLRDLCAGPVYLVGGTVRDLLLDSGEIKDIDVVLARGSVEASRVFADASGGSFFFLDEERRITRVMVPSADLQLQFDFAPLEGSDLLTDLGRRDFTMNAMALDLGAYLRAGASADIVDPFQGRSDIGSRTIRAVAPRVLDEDPLRLLRAVRFTATLGFSIAPETQHLIRERAAAITQPSPERVRDELFLILASPEAGQALFLLESLGLLDPLIPELGRLRGFAPGKHHQYDILTHSLKAAGYTEQALQELEAGSDGAGGQVREHLNEALEQGITRRAALRFACLLHDIAKAETFTTGEGGDVHFHGHDQAGADQARRVCERFRLSRLTTSTVERLVRHHMRPLQLSQGNGPSRRALYRYCRDLKEALPESLVLALSDARATAEIMPPEGFTDTAQTAARILEYYYGRYCAAEERPLVSGKDLIALGMRPGPAFRDILDAVRERQAAGAVRDRERALELVRELSRENSDR